MFLAIIAVLLIISFLVTIHEFGHYITALKFGMCVEEFSIGMGPAIYKHISKKTGILYAVRCLPIGGYCKIKGEERGSLEENTEEPTSQEDDNTLTNTTTLESNNNKNDSIIEEEIKEIESTVNIKQEEEIQPKGEAFCNKKIWQRAVVLCAGVTMNFIFAIIATYICLIIGMPTVIDNSTNYNNVNFSNNRIIVSDVLSKSSLDGKIKIGEQILEVNGQKINSDSDLQNILANNEEIFLKIKDTNGEEREIAEVKKQYSEEYQKELFGIGVTHIANVSYGPLKAIPETFKTLWFIITEMFKALGNMLSNIFTGHGLPEELSGPVGITVVTNQAIKLGFSYVIFIIAQLSLNLAIINILPFPALDGGRVLFLIFEKIKGKPLNEKFELIANGIGFLLLMALIVCVTFKDVGTYIIK